MKVDRCILREIRMTLKAPFKTSFETAFHRRILLVEIQSDGLSGWGEVTVSEWPYYNSEATDTAWTVLEGFLIPAVVGRTVSTASEIPSLLLAVRGHEMSKAGIENAIWDLEAQQKGVSLSRLIGGVYREIRAGVSLGIQPTPDLLFPIIDRELAAGYQRIKLKIAPGQDVDVVRVVRERYPAITLSVDANSAYRSDDIDLLRQLDNFGLLMIEQPLQWDEMYAHATLQRQLQTDICLDECIRHGRDATAAIELKACRIINIKLGRVGGHSEARRVQEICRERSVPAWCGGMLESGIGRAHNVAMSSLPGFVLPGDVSASQRYWHEDIIEPEVEVTSRGTIPIPSLPGLGYRVRTKEVEALTVRRQEWKAASSQ
jgi:o-succinylbenzoate synthase